MLIQHCAEIHYPTERVYHAFLHGMEQLPPWLPSIQQIEQTRFDLISPHQVEADYKWMIDQKIIPSVLRPFFNMKHVRSTTTWCAQRRIVDFEFFHEEYRELFDCHGTFVLKESGPNSMHIEILADLQPYPERVPGMPAWVARRSIPLIEKLIADILKPSLLALPEAIQAITGIRDGVNTSAGQDSRLTG